MRHDAGCGIDGEGEDLFRPLASDFLDIHAAFSGHDEGNARCDAVDQRPQIAFTFYRRTLFNVEAADDLTLGTGLMGHERRAQDAGRLAGHLLNGVDDLDTAGFAAPAGVDLSLDDPYRPAELMRRLLGFCDRKCRNTARHRNPEFPQNHFGLIFMDVHGASRRAEDGRPTTEEGRLLFREGLGPSVLRGLLTKARRDLEASVHQAAYGIDGFFQHRPLGPIEFDLHDPFDALGSDHHRDAHVEVLYAEF